MTQLTKRAPLPFVLIAVLGLAACADGTAYFAPTATDGVHAMHDFTPFYPGE